VSGALLLEGARTPIGKLAGSLARVPAVRLGAAAISGALARSGVAPERVDYVVMGHVLQAGQGQDTARQAAVAAGIPMSVPATTVNKVCLSGLNAIHLASLMIAAGEAEVVVAGGMESMSGAPHLVAARPGVRFGDAALRDAILVDGLTCAFDEMVMGEATERHAAAAGISREAQDEVAARSHARAAAARDAGRLAEEIVALEVPVGRGAAVTAREDEGIRAGSDAAALAALRPAFSPAGTITAGNSSQISDGAAAVVVVSSEFARRHGAAPLAEIAGYGQVAGPDASLLTQPSRAVLDACARAGVAPGDLGLLEINEAFAAVVAASARDLGVDAEIVNVNGGAIALGHPVGMSGARLALTLAYELRRRGGGLGAAALCGGGGQGDAVVLRSAS